MLYYEITLKDKNTLNKKVIMSGNNISVSTVEKDDLELLLKSMEKYVIAEQINVLGECTIRVGNRPLF